ncbi:MAG: ABC transporter permease [Acetivibrionales bacterium]|jgi:NitT/TauT family transport system permease protein
MGDKKRAEKLAAVIAALAVWQVFAMILGNSLLVAAPLDVAGRLFNLCISMEFWRIVGFSFVRIVYGFILALAAGIVFAILASRFRIVETMLFPYMLAVKSTPVASFIVLCLIWLSSKSLSVFIAFLIVLPIVYTNALHGIRDTDQKLLEMADLFRVRWWRKLYYIYIPQLKPYLLSACSVSIGMSWKAGIAAEVIGIPEGSIGEKLYEAKVYFSSVDLFAWTVAIIVLSILSEKLFIYILKSFLKPR